MTRKRRPKTGRTNREAIDTGTPETRAKLAVDQTLRLLHGNVIDVDQFEAAVEIREMQQALARALARTQRQMASVPGGGMSDPADYFSPREAAIYSQRLKPWLNDISAVVIVRPKLTWNKIVNEVLIENRDPRQLAAVLQLPRRAVDGLIIGALSLYAHARTQRLDVQIVV